MLTFKTLVEALQARGLTRTQGAIATGWGESDEALERFISLNSHFTPDQAAEALCQCLGEIGTPLFRVNAESKAA